MFGSTSAYSDAKTFVFCISICNNILGFFYTFHPNAYIQNIRNRNMALSTSAYGDGEMHQAIDISQVEASDNVQSHLSTTTSSKRLRITYSNQAELTKENVDSNTEHGRISVMKRILAYGQTLIFSDSTALLPGNGTTRMNRLERISWVRLTVKCAIILYCCLSCTIASLRLYVALSKPPLAPRSVAVGATLEFGEPQNNITGIVSQSFLDSTLQNANGVAQYFLRSLAMSSAVIEPYAIRSVEGSGESNVTVCGWLPDTKVHLIREWVLHWKGNNCRSKQMNNPIDKG